jgi:hypothetical protein
MQRDRVGPVTTNLSKDSPGSNLLALESRCKSAHDLVPDARRFAQESRRPRGERYDFKVVTISRTQGTLTFPANFALVAAMNPCSYGAQERWQSRGGRRPWVGILCSIQ